MKTNTLIRRTRNGVSIATVLALGTAVADAHPGHSLTDATPAHLLTSPDHLAVLAVSGVLMFFGARLVQRRLSRRLLQGAGVLALAGAAVFWGIHI